MVGSFWSDLLRGIGLAVALYLLFRAQRYWFVRAWELVGRARRPTIRKALRATLVVAAVALVWPVLIWTLGFPRGQYPLAWYGVWLAAAMFSWIGVRAVTGVERLWNWLQPRLVRARAQLRMPTVIARTRHGRAPSGFEQGGHLSAPARTQKHAPASTYELLPNPSRRLLFQSTAVAVGIAPFAASLYGYFGERLSYVVERVDVPVPNLPAALDGLTIAQLSDIHLSAYLSRTEARRAVDMANELGAEMAVVTGDFITGRSDSLEDCIEEMAALRAPLGVWGCNGNHEIYAGCEDRAADLFRMAGMRLLRQENAQVVRNGQAFNLIGVDYQRTRAIDGPKQPMLDGIEPLVRRDVPNILLSHNPNAFPKAAELGVELTLAGHTHGGQVQVEILDHRFSAARFMTPFVAGLYRLPLTAGSLPPAAAAQPTQPGNSQRPRAHLYVNRGIGTVGTPIRIGSPPEITLLTLRRA